VINGAHAIIYSRKPEADRAFLRDVLRLPHVDVGDGWLIFGLPPAEVAVHPSRKNNVHELFFMCSDIRGFVTAMKQHGISCGPIQNPGYGQVMQMRLPGGGRIGVYQPRHERPRQARPRPSAAPRSRRTR
jgi:hypothetical protein